MSLKELSLLYKISTGQVAGLHHGLTWIPKEDHEANPQLHEAKPGHFVRCTCYENFHFPEERVGEENNVTT